MSDCESVPFKSSGKIRSICSVLHFHEVSEGAWEDWLGTGCEVVGTSALVWADASWSADSTWNKYTLSINGEKWTEIFVIYISLETYRRHFKLLLCRRNGILLTW